MLPEWKAKPGPRKRITRGQEKSKDYRRENCAGLVEIKKKRVA